MQFKNFKDVEAMLTSRGQRKIGNNTYLRRRDAATIGLQYHETDVVTFTPSGLILTSGGWRTVTTKERINWALESIGYRVSQDKGTWFIIPLSCPDSRYAVAFHDGIRVSYCGTVRASARTQSKETKRRARIMELINAYLRDFAWDKCGDIGRDCLYCQFNWPDATKNTAHLESHLKDKYYMISLVGDAMRYSGYSDTAITMFCHPEHRASFDRDIANVKRAMRRYFKGMLLDRTGE